MLAVPAEEVVRVHMSSGTTGKPVVTGYTRGDLGRWAEGMERVLRAADVTSADVLQNAFGYGLFTGGIGFHLGADLSGCVVVATSGGALAAGQGGELVLAGLRREASPVIRYRTRDRTILVEDPCACGSPFGRMRKVRGRTDDMLVIRGENVFPSQVEEILLQVPGLTGNYQLVVDRQARHLDTLQIRVEARADADNVGLR